MYVKIRRKQEHHMRHQHAAPTLIYQMQSLYLKVLVKKGHNSKKYSFHSYVPCLATAPCYDEQEFQVWC